MTEKNHQEYTKPQKDERSDTVFADIRKLTAITAELLSGHVKIQSVHLTGNARLSADQILDTMLLYEATPCCAGSWEQLEQWMIACQKIPFRNVKGYWRLSPARDEIRLSDHPVL